MRVAADKNTVLDNGLVFIDTIVVAGDGTAADVDIAAEVGIADIGQMAGLRAQADLGFFGFDKIADFVMTSQKCTGTQMGHGATITRSPR